MKFKQSYIVLTLVLLFIGVVLLLTTLENNSSVPVESNEIKLGAKTDPFDDKTVAIVDGEPIAIMEFMLFLEDEIATTHSYFYELYGDKVYHEGFWQEEIGGQVPIKMAKEKALEKVVELKIQQILMAEYDLWKNISYDALIQAMNEENQRRKNAIENGEIVYGVTDFEIKTYLSYVFSNTQIELKAKLVESVFKPEEQTLIAYYDEFKENSYRLEDRIDVQKLYIKPSEDIDQAFEISIDEMNDFLLSIPQANYSEGGFDESVIALAPEGYEIVVETYSFLPENAKADYNQNFTLLKAAQELTVGQLSEPILDRHGMTVMYIIGKETTGFRSYESVRSSVLKVWADEAYVSYINKLINSSNITINEELYESIQFNDIYGL